jgi:hypothetical protein
MCFRYLLTISTWPTIDIKVTLFQCILLRDITLAQIFWLSQSEERTNSVGLTPKLAIYEQKCKLSKRTGKTDRLASPYCIDIQLAIFLMKILDGRYIIFQKLGNGDIHIVEINIFVPV